MRRNLTKELIGTSKQKGKKTLKQWVFFFFFFFFGGGGALALGLTLLIMVFYLLLKYNLKQSD